jgi:hypothetical protein
MKNSSLKDVERKSHDLIDQRASSHRTQNENINRRGLEKNLSKQPVKQPWANPRLVIAEFQESREERSPGLNDLWPIPTKQSNAARQTSSNDDPCSHCKWQRSLMHNTGDWLLTSQTNSILMQYGSQNNDGFNVTPNISNFNPRRITKSQYRRHQYKWAYNWSCQW